MMAGWMARGPRGRTVHYATKEGAAERYFAFHGGGECVLVVIQRDPMRLGVVEYVESSLQQWRAKNFFGRIEYEPIRRGPPPPPECAGQMALFAE